MNPCLLHQLLPEDIQWLLDHSEQQMLQPNTVLSDLENPSDLEPLSASSTSSPAEANSIESSPRTQQVHVIIEGSLSLGFLHQQNSPASNQDPQKPNPQKPNPQQPLVPHVQDCFPLQGGDLWGAIPFMAQFLPPGRIKTLAPTLMLSIEKSRLEKKLLSDKAFAARFYRLLMQLLHKRLAFLNSRVPYNLALLKQLQLKEASTLFAALEDSDMDWLVAVGEVQDCQPGDRIIRLRQPLRALHIILEGSLGLMAPQQEIPAVYAAFLPPKQLPQEIEFARLSRGELLGDSFLVDPLPPAYSAQALRPTQLLSIPRWRLETKLLYDNRFAAQLYRVLATVLANKQHNLMSCLGFQLPMQELDDHHLHQVNLAESRFDWLSQRLHAYSASTSPSALAAIA